MALTSPDLRDGLNLLLSGSVRATVLLAKHNELAFRGASTVGLRVALVYGQVS